MKPTSKKKIRRGYRGQTLSAKSSLCSLDMGVSVLPQSSMAFVKVASLSRLAPGSVMEASAGGDYYAICNVEGWISALAGTCPHRGGPLGQGAIHGGNLVCPWHAWEFDCRTGAHDYNPGLTVATFPVQVSGDDILIDIP